MMKKILALIMLAAVSVAFTNTQDKKVPDLDWRELSEIGVEGQAWKGEEFPSPYARVPLKFKKQLTANVWNNSQTPTGMCVTFVTDSDNIWIDCKFAGESPTKYWFGFSGFDLYASDKGNFRWLATTPISAIKNDTPIYRLSGLNGKRMEYRVYLPLRNRINSAKIGVKKGSYFEAVTTDKKPVVFYGTSITHGAWALHSGLSHASIIGRRLHTPIVNLGFSGAAQMEIGMAEMLATINAQLYVVDATQNMDEKLIKARCEKFLRHLMKLRPQTPILVAEEATSARGWYWHETDKPYLENKCKAQREIVAKLQNEGFKNLHYVDGEWLFGKHGEASADNCHPGDIGMMDMADKFTPIIKKIIEEK